MDFFKSILSDDPEPPIADNDQESEPNSPTNLPQNDDSDEPDSNPNPPDGGTGWSFGGLIKTFASRSETVLETYRRDLQEFKSGLKKETDLFREAVKDLPASIEVSASAAFKSTAEIISLGLSPSDTQIDTSETPNNSTSSFDSRRYSRYDAHLRTIQSDVNSYCGEPEDLDDFNKWKLGFRLEEKSEEIQNLIGDNGDVERIYNSVVPNEVDGELFWCRYFYRVHKLKQQEDVRANLVKRAISIDDDEELTWDVDDEEEEEVNASSIENKEMDDKDSSKIVNLEKSNDKKQIESSNVVDDKGVNSDEKLVSKSDEGKVDEKNKDLVSKSDKDVDLKNDELVSKSDDEKVGVKNDELISKSDDEKVGLDEKVDHGESGKDSDLSVVSSQPPLQEEEDLGWDEIEDLGSGDEKKVSHGRSPNRADVRTRLSAGEEGEDLSWDIEDDDEPVKHTK